MDLARMPKHIAIIPNGNRRWAKERGLPTAAGHKKGYERTKSLARLAHKMGIKVFTIWGFSTENWKRAGDEVNHLMDLFYYGIKETLPEALRDEIRLIHIGRKDRLSDRLRDKVAEAEAKTSHFKENFLVVGLDYGGRNEIIRAVNRARTLSHDITSEEEFSGLLDTHNLPYPNPDLVINTSGNMRTSGLLPWQITYAEFASVNVYYPDFSDELFKKTIEEFMERKRTFGV